MFTLEFLIPFAISLLAGFSTVIGSFFCLNKYSCQRRSMSFLLGLSAGAMIYLSFIELLPEAIKHIGFTRANIFFFVGFCLMAIIDFLLPHHFFEKRMRRKYPQGNPQLYSTGLMVTVSLAIHNFPEGVAVFLSSYTDLRLGLIIACAVAIHNIPEGIAVATPIYYATGSRAKAIKYAFISGIAEPIGALMAYWLLRPYLSSALLTLVYAVISGIMIYVSFDELLPACFRGENGQQAIAGLALGMFIVSMSLVLL